MELGTGPALAEGPIGARVDDIMRSISDLRNFLVTYMVQEPLSQASETPFDETPAGLEPESDDLRTIKYTGPTLLAALGEPAAAHRGLDAMLMLDGVSRLSPDFASSIPAFGVIDAMTAAEVDAIIAGSDELLSVKMLRLICNRAASGSDMHIMHFRKYLPKIIHMQSAENDGELTHLYDDLICDIAKQACLGTGDDVTKRQGLLVAFLQEMGYSDDRIVEAWLDGSPDRQRQLFLERNVSVMMSLERREPGLAHKITETFKTLNFGRSDPDVLADTYYQRLEHPEVPYILSMQAVYEHNFSSLIAGAAKTQYYYKLKRQGVRFEEYECADIGAIGEVAYQAQQLYETHGTEIVDLMLAGHSDGIGTLLSEYQGEEKELDASNMWYLRGFQKAMSKDARFLMTCCLSGKETGKNPSLAEVAARVLGREVVGSTVVASNHRRLKQEGNKPRMDVKYIAHRPFWSKSPALALLDLDKILLHPLTLQEFGSPRAILPLLIPAVALATKNVGAKRRFIPPESQKSRRLPRS